jgi:hypothetical protein
MRRIIKSSERRTKAFETVTVQESTNWRLKHECRPHADSRLPRSAHLTFGASHVQADGAHVSLLGYIDRARVAAGMGNFDPQPKSKLQTV